LPRYFFDICDSAGILTDPDGQMFDTLDGAMGEARKARREIVGPGKAGSDLLIQIRTRSGLVATVDRSCNTA